ncbi:MAG: right-handed parallel beta-helix repeat-containing protein [Wenzhouxiangella sp.]
MTAVLWLGLMPMAWGQTFLVNSVGDEPLATAGSISCVSTAGTCTLRAAIQANNNRTSTFVTLSFASVPVPPGGDGINDGVSSRIILNSALPTITRRITILGETHPNFDAGTGFQRVQIDGGNVTTNSSGLFISGSAASGTVIRNVAIRDAANHGISVSNADNVIIQDNRLGLYNLFSLDVPAGNANFGLSLNNSSGSQVLGNRIADNDQGGLRIAGSGSSGLLIAGNLIGAQQLANGSLTPRGNGGPGIHVLSSAGANNEIGRCLVIPNVSNFCQGNVVVANAGHGIHVERSQQSVVFNVIGLDGGNPDNANFGNAGAGVRIAASSVFVGPGIGPGNTSNIIAHSGQEGVLIASGDDNTVSGNRIGALEDGTGFGNAAAGVRVQSGGGHLIVNNLVRFNDRGVVSLSGPTEIRANTVRNNGDAGIEVFDWRHDIEDNVVGGHEVVGIGLIFPNSETEFARVYGNWVGTAPDGSPIGNANGIVLLNAKALVGGDQGRGNIVAGNVNVGIVLAGTDNSFVQGNFIGELPDGTPRGNGGTGLLLDQGPGASGTALSLVGYPQTAAIPANHVQDASGQGGRGNIIAHNQLGIRINASGTTPDFTRNRFRGNRMHGNSDGGIQIFGTIGSVNEGAGEGPNRLLNHPQLDDNATFFNADAGAVDFRLKVPTLASQATYPLRIDFYLTEPGESQGRFYLGSVDYPAASANTWVSGSFSPVGGYALGSAFIVAMATDGEGNSSEFSAAPADLSLGSPSPLDNIIISSFGDAPNADPASLSCDTGGPFIAPGVPNCTLRAAIQAANNHADPVTITFWDGLAAPGGVSTFAPLTQLPAITGSVTLAGESHAAFNPANGPAVVISGANQSTNNPMFRISGASEVEIRHVGFVDSPREGLSIANSSNVVVRDSLFGLRPDGGAFVAAGNSTNGIQVSGSSGLQFFDNWIADNGQRGVQLGSGAADTLLIGNVIGAGRDGSGNRVPLGNNVGIIVLSGAGSDIKIGECTGVPPIVQCPGNTIVANVTGLSVGGSEVYMAGNWIGVDPDNPGDSSFGNLQDGVRLSGSNHTMIGGAGGAFIGDGANIIGHSGGDGVVLNGEDHYVFGVFSGLTPSGDNVANGRFGIYLESGSEHVVQSARVSNNQTGIRLDSGGNTVRQSRILGNQNHGIVISAGPQQVFDNVVGGNGQFGVLYSHESPNNEIVNLLRNRVGVAFDGSPLPNGTGIYASNAGFARIGNDNGDGNIVAFNTVAGIFLDRSGGSEVKGNWIGVLPDGTPAGNQGPGIAVTSLAQNANGGGVLIGFNTNDPIPASPVGGGAGALGNVIAHNDVGVLINTAQSNVSLNRIRVRGNRIYGNADTGVQLGPNAGFIDPGGAQEGPNRLMNHPQFDPAATFIDTATGNLVYRLQVPTAPANAEYPLRVDFYLSDAGEAQGHLFIGSTVYPESSAENWLSGSLSPIGGHDLDGALLVAMATDADGNSSEFTASPVALQPGVDPIEGVVISALGDEPNADPGSTVCDTGAPFQAPGVPTCTLRAAIQAANNHTNPVAITFWEGLPSANGVTVFSPTSPLPSIGSNITLAGETHPDFNPAAGPSVVLSGSNLSGSDRLLQVVSASNTELRHIAAIESPTHGLRISAGGNVVVRDSLFGLRPNGGAYEPAGNQGSGILVLGTSGLSIDNNWIAANGARGVMLQNSASNAVLVNNVIGAGRTAGGQLVPHGNNIGVLVSSTAGGGIDVGRCSGIPPNQVCQGNVIVANGGGVFLVNDNTSMAANWIGVNPDNPTDQAFGNAGSGVLLQGSNHVMTGGLIIGQGANVVGHNSSPAILIEGEGHTISGAFVGQTPAGDNIGRPGIAIRIGEGSGHEIVSSRVANYSTGIQVSSSGNRVASSHLLDHSANGIQLLAGGQLIEDNVIGGNQQTGVVYSHPFDTSPAGLVEFYRNRIGVDQDDQPRPNGTGLFGMGAGRTEIGGDDGDGNIIAFNQERGIGLATGRSNRIRGNWIGVLPDGTPAGNGAVGVLITTGAAGPTTLENVVGFAATATIPQAHADGGAGAFGNVIGHQPTGILLNSTAGDAVILRNSLRGNRFVATAVPVQLGDSAGGSDPGGGQDGPNRLQNPPEFDADGTAFDEASNTVSFSVRVDTLAGNANYPIRIDIYQVVAGQPDRLLHTETYTAANATEFVSGAFSVPAGLLAVSDQLVGMATDDAGNSSEFSQPVGLGELGDVIFSDRFQQ